MNAVLLFVFGVFALQSSYAQVIRSAPVVATAATTPIIQTNNVANTLAETLSLLTVSSLLADKLPFECPCGCAPFIPPCNTPLAPIPSIAPIPSLAPIPSIAPYMPAIAPYEIITPIMNNCGCGCNGLGPYNAYVL